MKSYIFGFIAAILLFGMALQNANAGGFPQSRREAILLQKAQLAQARTQLARERRFQPIRAALRVSTLPIRGVAALVTPPRRFRFSEGERFRSRRVAILDQRGDLVRAQAQFLAAQNERERLLATLRSQRLREDALLNQQIFIGNTGINQNLILQQKFRQLQASSQLRLQSCLR